MRGRTAIGTLLAALVLCAPAQADVRKLTFSVPVRAADEIGQPVSIDTDVYLPDTPAAGAGRPLLVMFHGGGSDKANGFDAGHAKRFAQEGFVSIIYSSRGHGASGGQTTIVGPKEISDIYDVIAWALRRQGRTAPAHDDWQIDPAKIVLTGYSHGGLHTNLGAVWQGDRTLNPYGIAIRAIEPGNTPDFVYNALVGGDAVKLSFGAGLLQTYYVGAHAHVAPLVDKWVAAAVADVPQLYGTGVCQEGEHDSLTSSMQADLAWRSVGCRRERVGMPWLWAQAFDDTLFTPDMAISMERRAPNPARHLLYLSMGGHAAPAADDAVERDKLEAQVAFFKAVLAGRKPRLPKVTYWTRDPAVAVPEDSYKYPPKAWVRHTAKRWPPPGTTTVDYRLGGDGRMSPGTPMGAAPGSLPLLPPSEDAADDPVLAAAFSATPAGTSPLHALPATDVPGLLASFRTDAFPSDRELSGQPVAQLAWTPLSPDTQLVAKLFDEAPDGGATLLTRGVTGVRGATPGQQRTVEVRLGSFSALIRKSHRLRLWISDGDLSFYKPYPDSLGGILGAGGTSSLSVPLRVPPEKPIRR